MLMCCSVFCSLCAQVMEPGAASSGGDDNQQLSALSGNAAVVQVAPLVSSAASVGVREEPVQISPSHSPPPSIPTSPGALSSASSTSSPRSATGRVMGVVGIARTSHSDMDASGSSTSGSPHKSPPPPLEDVVMSADPRANITRTAVTTESSYVVSSKDTSHSVPSPSGRKSFSDEVRKIVYQGPPIVPKPSQLVHAAKPSIVPAKPSYPHPKPTKTSPNSSTSYESDC